ncbi:MAG: hypothetical protein A2Y16_04650 [Tenericutes bacterium GWF2_57_13]|nr:MAG: hypothetical protein A2Y16_04650 [Tenericutes bacterium GWF2_57_13]
MADQRKNIGRRYFWSIIVDFLLWNSILVPLIVLSRSNQANMQLFYSYIVGPSFFLFLLGDKIFRDASPGKRIFGLCVVSVDAGTRPTVYEIVTRRIVEIVRISFWIIPRLKLDPDRASNTHIVLRKNAVPTSTTGAVTNRVNNESLIPLRFQAGFYDFLWVVWLVALSYALAIPSVINFLDAEVPGLRELLSSGLMSLLIAYHALKDLVYRNQSYGKRKVGIELLMESGEHPAWWKLILRGLISYVASPFELLALIVDGRLISERLTGTLLRRVNPNNPQKIKRKVLKS